jgi:ABC-type branched-subunit amino acid transport system ATPase component
MNPGNLLEVRGLRKTFSGVLANDSVSLDVPQGVIVGLIGPNGSGKTTLFNSIAGFHRCDAGSVHFDGREITSLPTDVIARLGLVRTFQQPHVYARQSCLENMRASLPQAGEGLFDMFLSLPRSVDARAFDLLDLLGLAAKRHEPAGELSYGQQKLLEFAMALMTGPKLLLLDEPTAGVSPALIDEMIDRLARANSVLGVSLLLIEHNLHVVMRLAKTVYCLARGRVIAEGTPEAVNADPHVMQAYLGA